MAVSEGLFASGHKPLVVLLCGEVAPDAADGPREEKADDRDETDEIDDEHDDGTRAGGVEEPERAEQAAEQGREARILDGFDDDDLFFCAHGVVG